jgi:hypothetical protein
VKVPIAATVLVICLASPLLAATGIGGMTYEISLPSGDTRDFTGGASFRGMGVHARWFRTPTSAIGFSWDWNVFHEQGYGTREVDPGHVTGHNFRRVLSSPILLTYHLLWGSVDYGKSPLWYAGLGAGGFWIEKKLEVGSGIIQTANWHAGVCPEAGVYYYLSFNAFINLAVRYAYAFKSGDDTSQSYISFIIGIAWAT